MAPNLPLFLSTLSLRRATALPTSTDAELNISIHALLAESDAATPTSETAATHFYPRSPCGERRVPRCAWHDLKGISIHALLAESDGGRHSHLFNVRHFYPRSPCGERQPTTSRNDKNSIFLSTLSLRRATETAPNKVWENQFLSTLSLRRATTNNQQERQEQHISIHALLAESDYGPILTIIYLTLFLSTLSLRRATWDLMGDLSYDRNFYPRSPCGERHLSNHQSVNYTLISIHALLAESDVIICFSKGQQKNFYPRSPCGERP